MNPSPASSQASTVSADTHLTLHYRLSIADGTDIVSTFGQQPATLQMNTGQLSPGLEARLLGLTEGDHRVFELAADEAFGPRNPDLLQRLTRALYDEKVDPDGAHQAGDVVRVPGPDGGYFQGVLRELTDRHALLDFNHPLAGQTLRFEVQIIGVL